MLPTQQKRKKPEWLARQQKRKKLELLATQQIEKALDSVTVLDYHEQKPNPVPRPPQKSSRRSAGNIYMVLLVL